MSLILSGTNGLSDVDGTAATPAIRGTDTNTGIFFPAADTVAASVGGTEGLRLTSTGLTIGGSTPRLLANMSGSPQSGRFAIQNSTTDGNTRFYLYPNGTGNISAINMWNNSDPSAANYSSVDIGIISTIDVRFSSQASGSASVLPMTWYMGASERMRLDSSGNLGLGVTPSAWTSATGLQVQNVAIEGRSSLPSYATLSANGYTQAGTWKYISSDFASRYTQFQSQHIWFTAPSGTAGNAISFTQAMTLDSSGRLLVGTTSNFGGAGQFAIDQSGGSIPAIHLIGTQGVGGGGRETGATFSVITNDTGPAYSNVAKISAAKENATQGNTAGYMAFSTTPNGGSLTERARITSAGYLLVGTTAATGDARLSVNNPDNVSGDFCFVTTLGSNCNNTSSYHYIAVTGAADKFYVYGNGNVVNTNGSYGTLSDVKLKENIVNATPKLADVMRLQVRNFNLKTEPGHKQIGFVAQEFEQVFPAMVDESPDRDEEGNQLETTTKHIKTSVLVPILVKAIQEQQAIIESLTARITALEAK